MSPSAQRPLNPRVTISGTFEVLGLYDLLVNLTSGSKDARIYALVDDEEAEVIIYRGEVIGAAYRQLVGEQALLKLVADTHGRRDIEFVVESLPEGFAAQRFRTIQLPLEQLLLAVVMQIEAS